MLAITTLVIGDLVLQSPQQRERRNRDEHRAARLEDPRDLPDGRAVVIEMLDHVGRQHQIGLVTTNGAA